MKESKKQMILADCKIMLRKIGDIPFDQALPNLQKDLWQIGDKYGITGIDVFKILMDNFPKKNGDD